MKPDIIMKEKQLEAQIKQKIKYKASQFGHHLSKPLPSLINKTSTQIPSYIRPQEQTYLELRQNLHQIVNKGTFMSLRKQMKTLAYKISEEEEKPKSHKLNPKQMLNTVVGKQSTSQLVNTKVMGCLPNENSLAQLWAFVADELHQEMFYICNVDSNLAIKVENDKVVLATKQKTKEFLFYIPKDTDKSKPVSIYRDAFNIISSLNGKSLSLKGVLVLAQTNNKDDCQLFYIKKVGLYHPKTLRDTYILSKPGQKQKVILSVNKQKELCYNKIDYSLHQRWVFSPTIEALDRNKKNQPQTNRIKHTPAERQIQKAKVGQQNSKLDQLNAAQIKIITHATKNLMQQYDNDCCQIINYKLEESLIVKQEKGVLKLIFVPKTQKRQWKLQYDGFSIKIKHEKTNQYLGIRNDKIELTKEAHYWQVFQSSKSHHEAKSRLGMRRGSFDEKTQKA